MKKLKTKRSRVKFPALKPHLNLKTRYDEIADVATYANKLSEKLTVCWCSKCEKCLENTSILHCPTCLKKSILISEKQFMNYFNDGYINASRRTPIFTNRTSWKKNEDRNNARNRCIMTRAKSQGKLIFLNTKKKEEPIIKDGRTLKKFSNWEDN